ncbi:MAG: hypothetical protein JGK17_19690 [Microcoleus sp. PH2017_10_PVI_O_A]|uniref:hypothetical protein n=1 Tax=unclassified Microcoleus TaxID=2642155 RepID=UPI001DD7171D|nr:MULTISPECIES: hypothetical protein [unclassified Microcoleus]MCC3407772.1 hypothetical protein [Microcoleus sp. PH2017_10_PVI_O_A]MCC3479960.1 hypothetical protein [Microcoleus sp. PH2017_12_PCY_D_A]
MRRDVGLGSADFACGIDIDFDRMDCKSLDRFRVITQIRAKADILIILGSPGFQEK